MKERIRALRKSLRMTQADFGKRIGVSASTITGYELGNRTPAPATLLSIYREFDVNPMWLETGEGDMFVEVSRDEQVGAFLAGVWKDSDPFKQKIIAGLAALDENDWKNLKAIIEKMAKNMAGEE